MRAIRLTAANQLELADVPEPVPAPGEVLVSLRAAALNRRDVWIKQGLYAGVKFPCIPGSDGAGVVTSAGTAVVGQHIIINPSFDWGASERAQGSSFSILGLPKQGTLAERIAVPVHQLAAKPEHLSWEEAAALPLAGVTAWRALDARAQIHSTDRVLITGIGGGVALFALQFAVAHGAEVWVTSSSEEKIAQAVRLGAQGGFVYKKAGWAAAAKSAGAFDLIVDSAGGDGFNDLIDLAAPGGRLVFNGATVGNPSGFALRKVFWRQLSLLGTTMGSPGDWAAMMAFVALHKIKPVVSEAVPLARAADAFTLMERGGQFGKIVVRID